MKPGIEFLAVLILFLFSSASMANGEFEGTLEEVWVNGQSDEDVGWIKTSSSITTPACVSTAWFVLDLTKPSMKTALSFALAAQIAGRPVRIRGTGICRTNYEYVQFLAVK